MSAKRIFWLRSSEIIKREKSFENHPRKASHFKLNTSWICSQSFLLEKSHKTFQIYWPSNRFILTNLSNLQTLRTSCLKATLRRFLTKLFHWIVLNEIFRPLGFNARSNSNKPSEKRYYGIFSLKNLFQIGISNLGTQTLNAPCTKFAILNAILY